MQHIRFPDDLLALQSAWLRTYKAMAATPAGMGTSAYRRQLIQLSCAIAVHPFWAAPGRSMAARVELQRQARAGRWARAA
ncbi:hypothetical protein [Streptomyces sp. H34-S4]|uniref:hypothetical protein n=1 Tax=Streptomyces sp. H34-S4 TaxID=2996463 RepID=UPI0022703CDC|nr:hypothetical protein [Streptomyces sp. H34-S4]MCY0935942.1 hypothetical protein [Streptomyces sp. H34-S4]